MIYVTGDTHADFRRFNMSNFPEQREMTRDDYMIICGDFGGIWDSGGESSNEKYWLDWLENKPFTLLFVDGNHENFERLYSYPVKEWNSGRVHEIRPHILHMMRGQIFTIEGKKFFSFGGANSRDIEGGILEKDDPDFKKKRSRLNREYIPYRINHVSWWGQELSDEAEMQEGTDNLWAHNNTVDYIITHCCSTSTQRLLNNRLYEADRETDYLEYIKNNVDYKIWFFGHYHDNIDINDKEKLLYEQIVRIL